MDESGKPRIRVVPVRCDRFVGLGAGTSGGLYEERVGAHARGLIGALAPHAQLLGGMPICVPKAHLRREGQE